MNYVLGISRDQRHGTEVEGIHIVDISFLQMFLGELLLLQKNMILAAIHWCISRKISSGH